MNDRQLSYLKAMDIDVWQCRGNTALKQEISVESRLPKQQLEPSNSSDLKPDTKLDATTDAWACLKQEVAACTACGLHKTRKQTIFGVGDTQADLLIVGEAPGHHEDQQGEPFVGRAGQLLNAMLEAIGLQRDKIFTANILKCRPPNNRNPNPDEVDHCIDFLYQQIDLLQPKLMLAVGRIAAHNLLNTDQSLERLRGQLYAYGPQKTPLTVSYHPAYLLRAPQEKRKAYQDLIFIKKQLEHQK